MVRNQPPLDEPLLGSYKVILKGQGIEFKGLTTTAKHVFNLRHVQKMGSQGVEWVKLLKKLHLYAIQDGGDKILLVSTRSLTQDEYATPQKGSDWSIGQERISYRTVIAYGEVVDADNMPEMFKFFEPDFSAVATLFPENVIDKSHDFDLGTQALQLSETLILFKSAISTIADVEARDEIIKIYSERLDDSYDRLAEQTDRANYLNQEVSLNSPFSGPTSSDDDYETESLDKAEWILVVLAGYLGWMYLPLYLPNVTPMGAAVLAGGVAFFGVLIMNRE